MKLTWQDTDEIAWALAEEYPDLDPMEVSLSEIRKMVLQLDDFEDDPNGSSTAILEAIQAAWQEGIQ